MADTEQAESVGALMARIRWAKTGKAERARVGKMLVAARAAKRAARGTVAGTAKRRKAHK